MGKMHKAPKRPSLAPLSQAAETLSFLQDSPAKEKTWPEFGGKSTELRRDDHPNIDNHSVLRWKEVMDFAFDNPK